MNFRRGLFFLGLISAGFSIFGQVTNNEAFISPLDIPLVLSGNYGEIRSGHFHAGIDLKTQQVEGKRVYSVKDGYIARISVQSGGYGNALYIAHPGGYMTVYGHLREFMPEVEAYVRENQYKQKSFELNLFPDPGVFGCKQGDLIGYSGNSGSSGGPHLHFEIRDFNTSIPLNVLNFNMPVQDDISPRILWLAAYPLSTESLIDGKNEKRVFRVVMREGDYTIEQGKIDIYGEVGFGIETYDFLNGSANRCSPYSTEMMVDGRQVFRFVLDSIPFDLTNYVSSHIDYEEKIRTGKVIQKLFMDPNNRLHIYGNSPGGRIILPDEFARHEVRITVADSYGNASVLRFGLEPSPAGNPVIYDADPMVVSRFYCKTPNSFEDGQVSISLPQNVLFNNIDFRYSVSESGPGCISDTFNIHDEYTPLYKPFKISIKTGDIEGIPVNKLYIASKMKNGSIVKYAGKYIDGAVTANPGSFGSFFLALDTLIPVIRPVSFKAEGKYTTGQALSFRIYDGETGISKYAGYIDGQWALFKYDAKNNLISYRIDADRLKGSTMHDIEIIVTDVMDNKSRFVSRFFY